MTQVFFAEPTAQHGSVPQFSGVWSDTPAWVGKIAGLPAEGASCFPILAAHYRREGFAVEARNRFEKLAVIPKVAR